MQARVLDAGFAGQRLLFIDKSRVNAAAELIKGSQQRILSAVFRLLPGMPAIDQTDQERQQQDRTDAELKPAAQ